MQYTILILKPSSLGDIVHTLPAVHHVRAQRPDARIFWVANSEWAPLLAGNPDIDEVIEFPRSTMRGAMSPFRFLNWARTALPRRPDVVLDFQGLMRTALMARLSGAKKILGLNDAREGAKWLHHQSIRPAKHSHSVERYLSLARALNDSKRSETSGDRVFPLPEGRQPDGFDATRPYVLVHPFSRGSNKSLTSRTLRKLIEMLAPARVVLVGRAPEADHYGEPTDNWLNRTSLDELIWLLRNAQFVVSVDSGPMHLAAALNDKLLGLHSWSDPRSVGPFNRNASIWTHGLIATMGEVMDGKVATIPAMMPDEHSIVPITNWLKERL